MGAGVFQQSLAHAVHQPRLALNAPLDLAKLVQRDVIPLNRFVDRQIVIVLHRRVHIGVHLQIGLAHRLLVAIPDLLGSRMEDGHHDAQTTKRNEQQEKTKACHRDEIVETSGSSPV